MKKIPSTTEPDNRVVATQGSPQQEPQRNADKRVKIIGDLLRNTSWQELSLMKAVLAIDANAERVEDIPTEAMANINHCLNLGATSEEVKRLSEMTTYRIKKANEILNRHKANIPEKQHIGFLQVLITIAANATMIEEGFRTMQAAELHAEQEVQITSDSPKQ